MSAPPPPPSGPPTTSSPALTNTDFAASLPPHLANELNRLKDSSPEEILQAILPQASLPKLVGLLSGTGFPVSLPDLPDWAKNASARFWQNYFGPHKPFSPETIPDTGMFLAVMEEVGKSAPPPDHPPSSVVIKDFIPFIIEALHKEAQALSPQQAANFYKWRAKGSQVVQRFNDPEYLKMQRRAPIYLALACLWEEFRRFTSQAEAYRWLLEQKIIDHRMEIREVRAAFSLVGLRYRRPGRPRGSKKALPGKPKS